jgi:hypothetical protein
MSSPSSRILWSSLCSSDGLLRLRVITFAAVVPVIMRLPIDRVARWITPSGGAAFEPSSEDVSRLVAKIDGWLLRSRPLVRSGCIVRGVTLFRFLRGAGADVRLRFGIGLFEGSIAAHCWIEHRGEPVAELRDPRAIYSETWAFS